MVKRKITRNDLMSFLLRTGVEISIIEKLLGINRKEIIPLVPDITEVKMRRGRGNMILIVFSDGTERSIDFFLTPLVKDNEQLLEFFSKRENIIKFQFNKDMVFWDNTFSISKHEIFTIGKIIKDPFLDRIKNS